MRRIIALAVTLAAVTAGVAGAGSFTSADPLPVLDTKPGRNGLIVFEQQRKCGDRCGEYATGAPGIWTYNPKTGKRKLLVRGPRAQSPRFSRNGNRIVFSNWKSGQTDVFTMKPDGSDVRQITFDDLVETDPVYLADGRIGYLSLDDPYQYFSMKQDGSDLQPAGPFSQFESTGSTSLHDDDVAFTSCAEDAGPCHVFVRDSVTGVSTEATNGDVIDSDATFSPGGSLITYIRTRTEKSDDYDLEPGVWIMVKSGKRNRQIYWGKEGSTITGTAASPDGNKLLVENFRPHDSGPGGFGWIDVIDLNQFGSKRIRASKGRGVIEDADWQPR